MQKKFWKIIFFTLLKPIESFDNFTVLHYIPVYEWHFKELFLIKKWSLKVPIIVIWLLNSIFLATIHFFHVNSTLCTSFLSWTVSIRFFSILFECNLCKIICYEIGIANTTFEWLISPWTVLICSSIFVWFFCNEINNANTAFEWFFFSWTV